MVFNEKLEKVKLYELENFYFVLIGFYVELSLILIFLLNILENVGFFFFRKKEM